MLKKDFSKRDYKREIVKRYCYLVDNINYIIIPFIDNQTSLKFDDVMLEILENFVLGTEYIEQTELYAYLENNKKNRLFLNEIKSKLRAIKKEKYLKEEIVSIDSLLLLLENYLLNQNTDTANKTLKINVLKQYFSLAKFGRKEPFMNDIIEFIQWETENIGIQNNSLITSLGGSSNAFVCLENLTEEEKKQILLRNNEDYESISEKDQKQFCLRRCYGK